MLGFMSVLPMAACVSLPAKDGQPMAGRWPTEKLAEIEGRIARKTYVVNESGAPSFAQYYAPRGRLAVVDGIDHSVHRGRWEVRYSPMRKQELVCINWSSAWVCGPAVALLHSPNRSGDLFDLMTIDRAPAALPPRFNMSKAEAVLLR